MDEKQLMKLTKTKLVQLLTCKARNIRICTNRGLLDNYVSICSFCSVNNPSHTRLSFNEEV